MTSKYFSMFATFILLFILNTMSTTEHRSIHQFSIRALDSDESIHFQEFQGKKILVVNVASKCGFTNQYEDLEKLYQANKDHLVVIGFPCNQFMGQEPGSEKDIAQFCSLTYGVTFPMTEKIDVKGENAHEIYKWLTQKALNGKSDYKISWNFNKFLLDEDGEILGHFDTRTKPMDDRIISLL